jgi:hypothetical protein
MLPVTMPPLDNKISMANSSDLGNPELGQMATQMPVVKTKVRMGGCGGHGGGRNQIGRELSSCEMAYPASLPHHYPSLTLAPNTIKAQHFCGAGCA